MRGTQSAGPAGHPREVSMTPEPASPSGPDAAAARTHGDGHPLDEIHYREYKVILRPDRLARA